MDELQLKENISALTKQGWELQNQTLLHKKLTFSSFPKVIEFMD